MTPQNFSFNLKIKNLAANVSSHSIGTCLEPLTKPHGSIGERLICQARDVPNMGFVSRSYGSRFLEVPNIHENPNLILDGNTYCGNP